MQKVTIEKVTYDNYRNFKQYSLEFAPGVNILIGLNGSGKTNILESISLLSPGRGLKASTFSELANYEHHHAQWAISYHMQTKLGSALIESSYHPSSNRKIIYNGARINSNELPNLVNIVWLTPQMAGIFLGSASARRKLLDRIVYNFYPKHAQNLMRYEYFLAERNKVLKSQSWSMQSSWLLVLENKIAEVAKIIERSRQEVIANMQQEINDLDTCFPKALLSLNNVLEAKDSDSCFTGVNQSSINKHNDNVSISASDGDDSFQDAYVQNLIANRAKDAYSSRTNFGIHKSDLNIIYLSIEQGTSNNRNAKFCSTGEQKAMLISMTLASVNTMLSHTSYTPILLLDEFFVHLDDIRKTQLADYIISTKLQTLITANDIVGIEHLANMAKIINL